MQISIPLIQSEQDNIELRYCLRSISKYLTGATSITIIGYKPNWLQNVIHIPHEAALNTEWKEKNIYDKLCRMKGRFLYMNDDHFLLTEYNARKFPFYYEGTLQDRLNKCSIRNVYKKTVENTIDVLFREAKFYDIHCPVLMHRNDLNDYGAFVNWNKEFGYCLKTLYQSTSFGIETIDLKLNAQFDKKQIYDLLKSRQWFSTSETAWNSAMIEVMNELYPEKK